MAGERDSTKLIEGFVETAKARYMGYRFAMNGALTEALEKLKAGPQYSDEALTKTIKQIIGIGMDTEMSVIGSSTEVVLAQDPETNKRSSVEDTKRTVGIISDQLKRDGQRILKHFRTILLLTEQLKEKNGLSHRDAVTRAALVSQNELQFNYLDISGRRWKSEWFLELVVRSHFYQVLNQARLEKMESDGLTHGVILNPSGSNDGTKVRLDIWSSMKKIFHPNSKAIVAPNKSATK